MFKMWYWDYFPSGSGHYKKPLTKEQLKKMRESYEKGDLIREHVKQLESQEDAKNQKKIDEKLDSLFL